MWTSGKTFTGRGCFTPPTRRPVPRRSPLSERKTERREVDLFHVVHKVPSGDSPYVKAKRAQLIDKDFGRAVGLFWAAINAGDRVDSALKDMAIVMKQLNRSDEAIEAIKSFRQLCPVDSQESLDNILIELYKRSGRIDEEVQMLQEKLRNIEDRKCCHGGNRFKTARSQGRKIQVTADEERSRIMGNLAWAHIQKNDFETAEKLYREALSLKQDRNKQCNLAICLMRLDKVSEARTLLHAIGSSCSIDGETEESHVKSYERALEMLNELEGETSDSHGRFCRGEETCVINEEERGPMSSDRRRRASPKKKSWADIAEEEEEEEEEDDFDDNIENVDANVVQQQQSVALFGLEESKNAASVRRSLKFDSSDPCHTEVDVQVQNRPCPRKRLPVFCDITRLHHTA